jgi:hypothetical protein
MRPLYDVTYRHMWPSELLHARIQDRVAALKRVRLSVTGCKAWFDRSEVNDRLSIRIEVSAGYRRHMARRTLDSGADHFAVCQAIDGAFDELHEAIAAAEGPKPGLPASRLSWAA